MTVNLVLDSDHRTIPARSGRVDLMGCPGAASGSFSAGILEVIRATGTYPYDGCPLMETVDLGHSIKRNR